MFHHAAIPLLCTIPMNPDLDWIFGYHVMSPAENKRDVGSSAAIKKISMGEKKSESKQSFIYTMP